MLTTKYFIVAVAQFMITQVGEVLLVVMVVGVGHKA